MEHKTKPPKAGFQLKKKPTPQDDTLIKLYEQSELAKAGAKAPDAKKEEPIEGDDLSRNDEDIIQEASKKDQKRLAKQAEKDSKRREKIARKDSKKAKKNKPEKSGHKVKTFFKISIPLLIVAGVFVGLGFILLKPELSEKPGNNSNLKTEADEIYYSKLTGRTVNKSQVGSAATCIMIENSPDARPQSGLDEAGVVYEAIAEGGITRFMAIFQEAKPQYIGPVRSVRLTFVQFAKPYNCSIAHVGGSGNALSLIQNNSEFRDIDYGFNDDFYWRTNNRWAPHNVYTSFDKLDALNQGLGYTTSSFNGFTRVKPDTKTQADEITARTIKIEMSSEMFNPVYTYNEDTNTYDRGYEDGEVHEVVTEGGVSSRVSPDTVIAMEVTPIARSSEEQYADYVTTGSGKAYIFQNGTVVAGSWERANEDSELTFLDENGEIVALNRGQTWITAYPNSNSITWE